MAVLRRLLLRLGTFLRSLRAERDLARELDSHLFLLEDDFRRRGMTSESARIEAKRAIGGIEQTKELHRDQRSVVWLEAVRRDVRYAARSLARHPKFSILAITTLALAMIANSAIFSVVYAILLRPLPIRAPEDLVVAWKSDVVRSTPVIEVTYREFERWRDQSGSFTQLAALGSSTWPVLLEGRGDPVRLASTGVSTSFFDTLGAQPLWGRVFGSDDNRSSGSVILSHRLWLERFGGDPNVIGTSITLDRKPHTVVGVMPRDFVFPRGTDVWLPVLPILAESSAAWKTDALEQVGVLYVLGRLREGTRRERAREELDAVLRNSSTQNGLRQDAVTVRFLDHWLGPLRVGLWWLFAAVALLLAVACANVSALVLTRSVLKHREYATLLALGATRIDLARRPVIEIFIVAASGGVISLIVARWLVAIIVRLAPQDIPRLSDVAINLPVAGFTLLAVGLSAISSAMGPILHINAANIAQFFNDAARATTGRRSRRARSALVVLQISLAVVLLVGAGLIARSFDNLRRLDLGFDPANVLTMQVEPQSMKLPAAEWFSGVIRGIETLPGVEAAGAVFLRPLALGPIGFETSVILEGQPETMPEAREAALRNPTLNFQVATPGYFRTMRIPLLRGRVFDDRDHSTAPRVVVVGEHSAQRLWPGVEAIGKRLNIPQNPEQGVTTSVWQTVIGVVKDVHYRGIGDVRLDVYEPAAQSYRGPEYLVVRTSGNPLRMATAVQAQVRVHDQRAVIGEIASMEAVVARAFAPWRLSAWMLGFFSLSAFVLAIVGLGGLVNLDVASRLREFAVRAALGARPTDILKRVLSGAARLAGSGIAIGLAIAVMGTRALESFLFGVEVLDRATYAAVVVTVLAVILVASYFPARRAASATPMSVLRHE